MNAADQLPRVFQANADRFYRRVILPTLAQLPMHATLTVGEASTMDELLDRCAAQVDNHTANEAAKAFALMLDGMLERQVARWASALGITPGKGETVVEACARHISLDLAAAKIADDLKELHLVANIVRHGEGRSCEALKALAPQLWDATPLDYYDLAPGPVPPSDELRVRPVELRRYARAIVRFWGYADPQPMAVLDPPY